MPPKPGPRRLLGVVRADRWWAALGALAVVSTVAGSVAAIRLHGTPVPPFDTWHHLNLGRQWSTGRGLGSSPEISAGYPLFVAMIDLARRLSWVPVGLSLALGLTQAVVGGASVVLTGVLGRRVASPAVGLAAAGLLAVWPNVVLAGVVPLAEPVTTLLVLVVVVLLSRRPEPRRTDLLAAGAALALAVEMRPSALVLLALFLAVPTGGQWRARARAFGLGAAAVVVVIAPFAFRSSHVAQVFVPFDLRAGVNLCLGRAQGAGHPPVDRSECPVPEGATALEANSRRTRQAWRLFLAHPEREPGLVAVRARVTLWDADRWAMDEIDRQRGPQVSDRADRHLATLSTALARLTVALAAAGTLVAAVRRNTALVRVAAAGWLLVVPALVALGDARYRMPSIPLLIVVAVAFAGTTARSLHFGSGSTRR